MTDEVDVWKINRGLVRTLLGNTIETYPPEWRLIQEPLQNAVDSFILPSGAVCTPSGGAAVKVELFLKENKVVITDNGWGVPIERFTDFLFLGSGNKGSIDDAEVKRLLKGSQGVGIKATVFTSSSFELDTVHEGKAWRLHLPEFANYADDGFEGKVVAPQPSSTDAVSGTRVSIQLSDYSVRQFLEDRVAEFFETVDINPTAQDDDGNLLLSDSSTLPPLDIRKILMRYFKRDSYAGCVLRCMGTEDLPPVAFSLVLHADFAEDEANDFQFQGIKPLIAGKDLAADDEVGYLDFNRMIDALPAKRRPQVWSDYREVMENARQATKPTAFIQYLEASDLQTLLGDLRKRKESDPAGGPNILTENEDRTARNATALGRVNGAILFIASRRFLRNPLAHRASVSLSVNGLPTDIILEITGAELGYLPAMHLVIDVDQTLGYGKRNLPPRSKGIYNRLAKDLWRTLHKLAKFIVQEVDEIDYSTMGQRFNKVKELQKMQNLDADASTRLLDELGRTTEPETEEDTIAAYFMLQGAGKLAAYRWVRLNDVTIYDSLVLPPGHSMKDEGEFLTLEFKHSLKQLCESDERHRQRFEDMDLAIVWHCTPAEDLPPGYELVPIEQDTNFKGRHHPDASYRVKKGRHSVQIIALEEIVHGLPNAVDEEPSTVMY